MILKKYLQGYLENYFRLAIRLNKIDVSKIVHMILYLFGLLQVYTS